MGSYALVTPALSTSKGKGGLEKFTIQGLVFRVSDLGLEGFEVQASGFKVQGSRTGGVACWVLGFGAQHLGLLDFRRYGSDFRVRVWGSGLTAKRSGLGFTVLFFNGTLPLQVLANHFRVQALKPTM